jgi:hypothetical protein
MKGIITLLLIAFHCQGQDTKDRKWYYPDRYTLQFAGGIGKYSLGVGYSVFKKKGNVDVHLGYVPLDIGNNLVTSTLKLTMDAFSFSYKKFTFYPFQYGVNLNYTFGNRFYVYESRKFYPFQTAIRPSLVLACSVKKTFEKGTVRNLSLFLEASSNDFYLITYFSNKVIPFSEIIVLGTGLRMEF